MRTSFSSLPKPWEHFADTARGRTRGKQFRRTVSGIPTGRFRTRPASMAHHAQIGVFAVNAAYTGIWGAQHW